MVARRSRGVAALLALLVATTVLAAPRAAHASASGSATRQVGFGTAAAVTVHAPALGRTAEPRLRSKERREGASTATSDGAARGAVTFTAERVPDDTLRARALRAGTPRRGPPRTS